MSNVSILVKQKATRETLGTLLDKCRNQLLRALPRHMSVDRMIRVATTCLSRNPVLQECTAGSVMGCVIQAAELGLELAGPLGHCYMVPRHNKNLGAKEACFQVGYRGFIALAFRTEKVEAFPIRLVYKDDHFDYRYGSDQWIDHKPKGNIPDIVDPALPFPDNVKAAYSLILLKGATRPDFEVMTTDQIEAHRKRYAPDSYKANSWSVWRSDWRPMAMKTPCRILAKRVPLSVEFTNAAVQDEYGEAGVDQGLDSMLELPEVSRTDQVAAALEGAAPPGPESPAARQPGAEG